jgi:hypothetical protein
MKLKERPMNKLLIIAVMALSSISFARTCDRDTDDANLREVAANYVKKDLFTSSVQVRNVKVGTIGIGIPGSERTIYFTNEMAYSASPEAKMSVAGRLVISPSCKVIASEQQVLTEAP